MKTIHFDGVPSRSITVSDAGFEEIVALVTQHRRCRKNNYPYMQANPLVGMNLCLGCFLQEHTDTRHGWGLH